MALSKAEQEKRDKHDAWEKQMAASGEMITLPRSGEPGAPDYVPPSPASEKKKPTP